MDDFAKTFTYNHVELFVAYNHPKPSDNKDVFISMDNDAIDDLGPYILLTPEQTRELRDHLTNLLGE